MFIVTTNPLCCIERKASYIFSSLFAAIIYCRILQKLGNLYENMKINYISNLKELVLGI